MKNNQFLLLILAIVFTGIISCIITVKIINRNRSEIADKELERIQDNIIQEVRSTKPTIDSLNHKNDTLYIVQQQLITQQSKSNEDYRLKTMAIMSAPDSEHIQYLTILAAKLDSLESTGFWWDKPKESRAIPAPTE